MKKDLCVRRVIEQLERRSLMGIVKYGTTVSDNSLDKLEWLQHLQEELMDACVYIERLKQDIIK